MTEILKKQNTNNIKRSTLKTKNGVTLQVYSNYYHKEKNEGINTILTLLNNITCSYLLRDQMIKHFYDSSHSNEDNIPISFQEISKNIIIKNDLIYLLYTYKENNKLSTIKIDLDSKELLFSNKIL